MNKKKKIIIISVLILIAVVLAIVISIKILEKSKKENPSEIENTFITLMDNDYLIYYFYYGDVETSDEYREIDGIRYYKVTDEKVNAIDNIIDLNLNTYFILKQWEETNNYLKTNGEYYVEKAEKICKKIYEYNMNDIKYEEVDKSYLFEFDNASVFLNLNDDNKWTLNTSMQYCVEWE